MLVFKELTGKKMLALRLRSSSTRFASLLVFFSTPIFASARRKIITSFFSCSKRQNEADTKQAGRQKHKAQAGYTSPEFPQNKKRIPVQPLFKAVAPFFPIGIKLLVFLANWLAVSRFATHLQENVFL